jgi:amidase
MANFHVCKNFIAMNNQLLILRYAVVLCLSILFISCDHKPKTGSTVKKMLNLEEITIAQLQKGYDNGDYSIKEVVQYYLDRIEVIDKSGPYLNSIIRVNPDAMKIAEELDKELAEGKKRGPMHGVPVVLKDNIDTHDKMPTTAGSRVLMSSFPLQDSWVAKKLRESGAVILAKANLSEWANFRGDLSSSGWSGVGGQTANPYDTSRNPCGSSSGSGAAVSANLCMVAIGTETNGSIVCPASANGIVGIKPTVGLISRSGVIPISFTQDIPGPMARTVTDAAICLGVLTGVDPTDSKTNESIGKFHKDYGRFCSTDGLKGKRIGLYKKPFGLNYKVDNLMNETVDYLKSQGVVIIEVDQLYADFVEELSFQIMLYEYKDGLNNYFASLGANSPVKSLEDVILFNRQDSIELMYFDQNLMKMAQAKGGLETPEYKAILKKMLESVREKGIDKVMNTHQLDAIIAPTGAPAWKTDHVNGDAYHVGSSSPAAIAGYPNITVPMGFIDGLPVGISFFGKAWSEPLLLEIASAYEEGTKHRKSPELK